MGISDPSSSPHVVVQSVSPLLTAVVSILTQVALK